MIEIKTQKEIESMRVSGRLAAETLSLVASEIRAGMSTNDINDMVHSFTVKKGAIPAPLGYRGSDGSMPPFPKSVCTSINDVVCHGIPSNTKLKEGDIVNVDVTSIYDGFHGDTSATFVIGQASEDALRLVEVARKALALGIEQVKPGNRTGDIGNAIQQFVEVQGFSVVREYVGHGIGRKFHTAPQIYHFGSRGQGPRLVPGMTFTIEPMVNAGSREVFTHDHDPWTVYTSDGALSSQFEHTILVTEVGCEVLTQI